MADATYQSGRVYRNHAGDLVVPSGAAITVESGGSVGVSSPNAYTQTYSTADRTHAALTSETLTVSDGAGTNDATIGAITADASVIAAVQELADQVNKLVADLTDVKQLVNAVIDDLQTVGIAG